MRRRFVWLWLVLVSLGTPANAAQEPTTTPSEEVLTLLQSAHSNMGMGRLTEARADAVRALRLDPENRTALLVGVSLDADEGKWDEALAVVDALLKPDPKDVTLLARRADLLRRAGRMAEATQVYAIVLAMLEAELKKAPKLRGPTLPAETADLLSSKAKLLTDMGDYDRALELVNGALALQADNVEMLTTRCQMRVITGRELEAAVSDCDKAVKLESGTVQARQGRGILALRLQLWDKALVDFEEIIRSQPDYSFAFYGRGLARIAKGDRDGGLADLATARRQEFETHVIYDRMGLKP